MVLGVRCGYLMSRQSRVVWFICEVCLLIQPRQRSHSWRRCLVLPRTSFSLDRRTRSLLHCVSIVSSFLFLWYLCQISSDFASSWQNHTTGHPNTYTQPTASSVMCSQSAGENFQLYMWYFWSGHRIVPTWIQWTTKSGETCQSMCTARPYLMLLIWSSSWLLHGLVCCCMSLTRQLTSGGDSYVPVWELTGDTSNICFDNMNSFFA